jgi:hypothetical protein
MRWPGPSYKAKFPRLRGFYNVNFAQPEADYFRRTSSITVK